MKKYLGYLLTFLIFMGFTQLVLAEQAPSQPDAVSQQMKQARTAQQLEKAGYSAQAFQERFNNVVYSSMQAGALRYKTEEDIKALSKPEILAPKFMEELYKNADGPVIPQILEKSKTITDEYSGSITGNITVNGSAYDTTHTVLVIAFDRYGYFYGMANANNTGSYTIGNLPDGEYYIVTWSRYYVDEIYDDIQTPLNSLEAWRQAETVQVSSANVAGIDFDLEEPALVSGSLYRAGDNSLLANEDNTALTFTVTRANSPAVVVSYQADVSTGNFSGVPIPGTGDFKIHVSVNSDSFSGAWYGGESWETATSLTVADYGQQITGIDFYLQQSDDIVPTGAIKGTISLNNGMIGLFARPLLSIALAYDAETYSFAGFGLGILGSYTLSDLPEGNYIVFADDYLEDLQPDGLVNYTNYLGEYYNDALMISEATPVSVTAGQETSGIDFELDQGGEISGTITRDTGAPLDSLMMIAVNVGSLFGDEPILTSIGLGITSTDDNGNYTFTGLPNGDYLVATVSSIFIQIDAAALMDLDLGSIVMDGKYKGLVVDEFYNNVQHLGQLDNLELVSIEDYAAVSGIDMELETGAMISGVITDAETGGPVQAALLAVVDDESGAPVSLVGQLGNIIDFNGNKHEDLGFLTSHKIGADGTWQVGPLPAGEYTFLVVPGPFEGKAYLPEFYDGARNLDDATAITLSGTDVNDINISLDKSAIIQGFVDLGGENMYPAGADTLYKIPVLVYNTDDGQPVSWGFVQFNGGFRIDNLEPGSYKAAVLPLHSNYAVTYLGGGATFDDVNTETVTLDFGQVHTENISPDMVSGKIMGTTRTEGDLEPVSLVSVLAFDMDGHIAGYGISDYNIFTDVGATDNGSYSITGLRDGSYYLRSYSLTTFLPLVEQGASLLGMLGGSDLMGMATGFLFGESDINLDLGDIDLSMNIYGDEWYKDIATAQELSIDGLLMQILSADLANGYESNLLPLYFPLPLYQPVPGGAQAITIKGGTPVSNINFDLQETDIITYFTDVEEEDVTAPAEFALQQNYPNPFNPSTTLTYSLPVRSHVSVEIYDTLGRKVRTLVGGNQAAGQYTLNWNGRDQGNRSVAAGLYFATIKAGDFQQTIKMLLVK